MLVTATAVVLRLESTPQGLQKFVDPSVELVAAPEPEKPVNARTSALEPDTLQLAWAGNSDAYEVRWGDHSQLVSAAEAELTGLVPDQSVDVEIRSVNPVGKRSDPLVVDAVPRQVHADHGSGKLNQPIDRFDGPESLDPRQWRVLGDPACLGLRPFGAGKRLDVSCSTSLQSNRPLRLAVPDDEGVVGRVMLTAAGGDESSIKLQLLPEPLHDAMPLVDPVQGMVQLELTSQGTRLRADPILPLTEKLIPLGDSPATGLAPEARHRWEVRILKDAVIALRDGVVVAAEAVTVPWTVARPRILVDKQAMLDSFGIGGVPEREIPASRVGLGEGTDLGKVPSQQLDDAVAARLVLAVAPEAKGPVTVDYGGLPLTTKEMNTVDPRYVYVDVPLNRREPAVRTNVPILMSSLILTHKPGARPGPLPRLSDHQPAANSVPPKVKAVHDSGIEPATQFPRTGRVLITAEVANGNHEGIELEIDGKRLLTLPTTEDGPAARGRHEIWVKTTDYSPGGHRVKLTVLPPDHGEPVTTETVFEVRETS